MQLRRRRTAQSRLPRQSRVQLAVAGPTTDAPTRAPGRDGAGTLPVGPARNGGDGGGRGLPPGGGNGGGHSQPPARRPRLKKLRVALVLVGLTLLAIVSWIFGIMMAVASDLPQLEDRAQFASAHNSVIFDDHNRRLSLVTNNAGRVLIPSAQIAPVMKEATVAIEDRRFYQHRGVDFVGIGRAFLADVLHQSASQGGSTITEQFVKNALRAQGSRTVFEKLREAALAYQLERHWDKDKILSEYLNTIYFGNGAYGVEAAARTYFGWNHPGCGVPRHRCASELFPWEAAMLAGLISSPAGYDPKANPHAALARRNLVLQNMEQQGDITPSEYARYSRQPIPRPGQIRAPETPSQAPYFTSWVRQQLIDLYGASRVFNGGLQVKSTLDLSLEDQVQGIVDSTLGGLGGPSSAVVVLDNATGGVRAMVGGLDYHSQAFNIATQGARQPGSAFKPFTLVTALEQGISPSTTFTSAPQQLPYRTMVTKHGKRHIVPELFDVHNYEDEYGGVRDIVSGTTYSDNAVYSQLGMRVGPANVAETAQKMGIAKSALITPDLKFSVNDGPFTHYNPALVLGGLNTGVNPLEMAHAYDTLAEDGQLTSGSMAAAAGAPVGILKVTDSDGHPVPTQDGASGIDRVEQEQVVPTSVAAEAKSILGTVVSEGTGTNAQVPGQLVWGKTGTTTDNGDAWFAGSTKDITVAVWVGYPNSTTPMKTLYNGGPVDGGTYPADIFRQIVEAWDGIKAQENHSRHTTTTTTSSSSSSYVAPTTTVAPASPTTPPSTSAPAPTGGGAGGTGQATQAAPAPTQQAPAPAATPPSSGGTGGVSGGGGVPAG
jgi:penicillin-binding protein 1A